MPNAQMRSFLLGACRQSFRCRRMGSISSRSHPQVDLPVSHCLPVSQLFYSRVHLCDYFPIYLGRLPPPLWTSFPVIDLQRPQTPS